MGHLLVRDVVPRSDVAQVCAETVEVIDAAGWLLAGHDRMECVANPEATCGEGDAAFWEVKERILKLESLHAFIHHPALRRLMEQFAGPRVLVHPKFVLRVIFPNCDRTRYRIHQDHEGVRGDPECFTLWTPFADCPVERGALQVMETSHHFGLQGDAAVGPVTRETARGGDWVVGDINAGDVLLMHSLTVHEPAGNGTDRFRLSIDCRFQDYARDFNPINVVSAGGWNWETIYADWKSEEFKYYWNRLPLRLKPSMEELAEKAEKADAKETREKYARIVSQLEREMAQE
jgi:hypothetical protein